MLAKNTKNDFQKQTDEIVKKNHDKKVYFTIAIIFATIVIGLIVGIFMIVDNYEYSENNENETVKQVDQKIKNITCKTSEFSIKNDGINVSEHTDIRFGSDYFEIIQEKRKISNDAIKNDLRCDSEETHFKHSIINGSKLLFEKDILPKGDIDCLSNKIQREKPYFDYIKTVCKWNNPINIIFQQKNILNNKYIGEKKVLSLPNSFCEKIKPRHLKINCYNQLESGFLNSNEYLSNNIRGIYDVASIEDSKKKYLIDIYSKNKDDVLLFRKHISDVYLRLKDNGMTRKPEIDFYENGGYYHFIGAFDDYSRLDITNIFYFYFTFPELQNKDFEIDITPLIEKVYSFETYPAGVYIVENVDEYEILNEFLKENIKYNNRQPSDDYISKVASFEIFDGIWDLPGKYYTAYRDSATFRVYLKPDEIKQVEEFINKNWQIAD